MHQSKQYASQNYGSCDSTFRLWKSSQQQIEHHASEHQLLNEPYKADRNKEKDDVVKYAKKLQEKGARNVLISMAGEGAVLVSEDKSVFMAEAPKGTLINGVGAGDSMVAGFLAGWMKSHDYKEAFRMGVACGSASAFSEYMADSEMIEKVYNQVQVNECK